KGLAIVRRQEVTEAMVEDILRSGAETRVEGDSGLWRVEFDISGSKSSVYLAADHGVPKVIGMDEALQGVGRHVLKIVASDEKQALRLLDWAGGDLAKRGGAVARSFTHVWGTNLPRSRQAIELAAATLTEDSALDRAVPILERCGATTSDGQQVCDVL